jgi:uncharacterized YceG family protein
VQGRTGAERRRAAEERAARRAARERGEEYQPELDDPYEEPEPPEPEFEPLRSPRRAAPIDRPPMSRAARAQRIGRPGRPALPPGSPKSGRWFRRFLALLALAAIGAALYVINETFQPLQDENEQAGGVAVQIPAGTDAGSIGALLERRGVIEDARFFELNATLTLRRGKLRSGNYVLRRNMTNGAAIEALMQGPKVRVVKTFDVSIPEGQSRRESARAIDRSGIEGSYLRASGSKRTLRRIRRLGAPRGTRTAEGFLFPATYNLVVGATARNLVDRQLDAFRRNFRALDMTTARRRNLTRYDVLIIASLIERETPSDRERPLVSSVIYNRLRLGEPLGIDATIRYAENNWSRPLLESELAKDTPYNTRINAGLPPTPIGNPGRASLRAAVKPANTDFLFYVVKPGACHAFAETNAEHERNVAAYERAVDENNGKAPPQKC